MKSNSWMKRLKFLQYSWFISIVGVDPWARCSLSITKWRIMFVVALILTLWHMMWTPADVKWWMALILCHHFKLFIALVIDWKVRQTTSESTEIMKRVVWWHLVLQNHLLLLIIFATKFQSIFLCKHLLTLSLDFSISLVQTRNQM